jgi:hypothetical protein
MLENYCKKHLRFLAALIFTDRKGAGNEANSNRGSRK